MSSYEQHSIVEYNSASKKATSEISWNVYSDISEDANPLSTLANLEKISYDLDELSYTENIPAIWQDEFGLLCACPSNETNKPIRESVGKQRYPCDFRGCGKVYGKPSHLKAHLRSHSGERPYICSWSFCAKTFTRSDELQRHTRTHTGEKRFFCQRCEKAFTRSDHLKRHIAVHENNDRKIPLKELC